MSVFPESWTLARYATAALAVACQAALGAYAIHRWPMLIERARAAAPPDEPWWDAEDAPRVLVQLPVRDEHAVVGRLVAAAAALDWPRERLEIQLLDDSGAECASLGAEAVALARAGGVRVTQLRRGHRRGFKAGALAAGLARSDATFVAVFDADFVPPPDFLRRLMPHLAAPDVGMVQARWGHLNRDASLLTRAQAVLLDAHQLVEHQWRQRAGRFFNFNGTAGLWRRACIDSAGGWSHDTLTEDLDLSYRAQLAGWRFVFDPSVVVPAELPGDMAAFRSQQHRWARGALQTARKLLGAVARAPLPRRVKLEAFLHLTANVNYPLLLMLAALLVPVLAGTAALTSPWGLALHLLLLAGGTLPVALFLAKGSRLAGRRGVRDIVDVAAALVLCAGLSWHLTRAVFEGLLGPTGEFLRTPKTGAGGGAPAPVALARLASRASAARGMPELALAAGFAGAAVWMGVRGNVAAVPLLLVLAAGLTWVGAGAARPGARAG